MTAFRNFAYVADYLHSPTLESIDVDGVHKLQTRSALPSIPIKIDASSMRMIEFLDPTSGDVLSTIEIRTADDQSDLYVDNVLVRTINLQSQTFGSIILRSGSLQIHGVNFRRIGDVVFDDFDAAADPHELDEFGDPIADHYTGSLDLPVDWANRSILLRVTPYTPADPWSELETWPTITVSQIRDPRVDNRQDCPDAVICPLFAPFGVAGWRLESQTIDRSGSRDEILREIFQKFDHCETAIDQLVRTSPTAAVQLHATGAGFDDGSGVQTVEFFGAKIAPDAIASVDLFDASTQLRFEETAGKLFAIADVVFRYPAGVAERSPVGALETDDLSEIRSITPLGIGLDLMGGVVAQSPDVVFSSLSSMPADVTYLQTPVGSIQFVEDKAYDHSVSLNLNFRSASATFRREILATDTSIEFTADDLDGDIVDTDSLEVLNPAALPYFRPTALEFRGLRVYALVVSVFGFGSSAQVEEQAFNAYAIDTNAFESVTLPNNVYFAEFGPGQEIDGFDRYRLGGGWREWRFLPTFAAETLDLTSLRMRFAR
ncbi:hypothetical protein [Neorhodopirellula pilleata]|uniref:Uncharacterized protein n=1 Tax=Neorhodopirellula pilleata TaxID=2714738 RepID=A0A5C5ZYT5_9BACT|nr:hypothetical protein [Neorhodopirellula pilleata]TWT91414.1 hypothetical protein Pla100_52640 [Neorhodopirellula pilleata]TWT91463.1 hypothetical protein Pla100_53130 [Neorhodopirellula pilleata]